jgi:hypothetical protein
MVLHLGLARCRKYQPLEKELGDQLLPLELQLLLEPPQELEPLQELVLLQVLALLRIELVLLQEQCRYG